MKKNKELYKRDILIIGILKEELKNTLKLLHKESNNQKDTRKNVAKAKYLQHHDVMLLEQQSHMIGYLTAKKVELESTLKLLSMKPKEIADMLQQSAKTKKDNEKYLNEIFANIKNKIKKNPKK